MEKDNREIKESIFHLPVKKVRIELLENANEIKVEEEGTFFPK